jgi:Flp pilus assembly protein TadG
MTRRECGSGDEGAVLVECTVVLPVFFFLLFAMLDACRFVAQQAAVDQTVRQAGQYGAKLTESDCVTPSETVFLAWMRHTPFEAPVALQVRIATLADGTRGLVVTARASGNKLFALGANVASTTFYTLEFQDACGGLQQVDYPPGGP